ncbi:hypothetical protein JCM6882_004032 [Rhodosporidiobolus microsporus]
MSTTASSSFHFSPSAGSPAHLASSPTFSSSHDDAVNETPSGLPTSPPSADSSRLSPPLDHHSSSTTSTSASSDAPTPLFERPSSSSSSSTRPHPPTRSVSYKADDIWGTSPTDTSRSLGNGSESTFQRTARAASDGLILTSAFGSGSGFSSANGNGSSDKSRAAGGPGSRLSSLSSEGSSEEQAFFREHQRRSLEHSASQRLTSSKGFLSSPPLAAAPSTTTSLSAARGASSPFFQPPSFLSTTTGSSTPAGSSSVSLPPLLSPTTQSPPTTASLPQSASFPGAGGAETGPPGSKGATLHLGDLDVWMDEAYVRECCALMGWDNVVNVKMSRGASPSSGYCFLTFPSTAEASRVLTRFNTGPPMLMPRSGRTFKLNWGTGLPGLQPRWDGEWSVFVGDLAREVGESDLMTLFTPLFPSTKSAKVMCDPSTGLSRGYGFVRFAEESDMQRALLLGNNATSGLLLHGRTIRISEASGPGANGPSATDGMGHLRERTRTRSGEGSFQQQQQQQSQPHQQPPHLAQQQQPQQQPQQQGYFPPYPPGPPPPHLADGPGYGEHMPYASPSLGGTPGGYPPSNGINGGGGGAFSPSPLSPHAGIYGPPIPAPPGGGMLSPSLNGGGPYGGRGPLSPGLAGPDGGLGTPAASAAARSQIRQPLPAGSVPQGGDPNNTTVFVGGLPACISEETLKSFFHHFGEITYCKIPAGKGCGFVQFVRRQDAELAIAKMNDFPIHGKSRIRLSWGRSQGDKQVEHVRKLASALGVPFDAVWRMVQGQDNSTIKQIASAVGTSGTSSGATAVAQQAAAAGGGGGGGSQQNSPPSSSPTAQHNRMDLRAVANAAGLTESEVLDLVKTGSNAAALVNGAGSSSEFFPRSAAPAHNAEPGVSPTSPAGSEPRGGAGAGAGPYSRVSPSSFAAAFGAGQLPLSPPPSAGPNGVAPSSFAQHQAQFPPPPHQHQSHPHPHAHQQHGAVPVPFPSHSPSPYTAIRPESYALQHPASSPYERVDFADGGRPNSTGAGGGGGGGGGGFPHDRYQPQAFGIPPPAAGKWHDHGPDGVGNYTTSPPPPVPNGALEDGFAGLSLHQHQLHHHPHAPYQPHAQAPRSLPPPLARNQSGAHHPVAGAPEFFPTGLASPTSTNAPPLPPTQQAAGGDGWGWNGVGA